MSKLLFSLMMALGTNIASAASPQALHAQRDATAEMPCQAAEHLPGNSLVSHRLDQDTRLYVVPCRTTVADLISVVVIEEGSKLRTLSFPDPGMSVGERWADARLDRIGVTTELSSPHLRDDGTLVTSNRIPPGMGEGAITQHYRIEDGSAVLRRFAIELQGQRPIILWPQP